jgi:hypothetical protein
MKHITLRPENHFWSPGASRTEAVFVCSLCEKPYDIDIKGMDDLVKKG